MRFVIALANLNSERGGGPFAAAVFHLDSHRLLAPGVNLVTDAGLSIAHAEMVAISIAQKLASTFDLASVGEMELVTSTAPCAMCLGAIPWSGVKKVVCGARGSDAEAIGFDEGAKPIDWVHSLSERRIEVVEDVERDAARKVLTGYAALGGEIYNGGNWN